MVGVFITWIRLLQAVDFPIARQGSVLLPNGALLKAPDTVREDWLCLNMAQCSGGDLFPKFGNCFSFVDSLLLTLISSVRSNGTFWALRIWGDQISQTPQDPLIHFHHYYDHCFFECLTQCLFTLLNAIELTIRSYVLLY